MISKRSIAAFFLLLCAGVSGSSIRNSDRNEIFSDDKAKFTTSYSHVSSVNQHLSLSTKEQTNNPPTSISSIQKKGTFTFNDNGKLTASYSDVNSTNQHLSSNEKQMINPPVNARFLQNSTWQQIGEDIDGEAAYDFSGYQVALSKDGNIVAIGAPKNDNGNKTDSGHVRVYEKDSNHDWKQVGNDINGEATDDKFGRSVALSANGTILAISSRKNDNNGSNSGHVRVYKKGSSTSWTQVGQDIEGEAAEDRSGTSIALSDDGSILAIGANLNDGENGKNSGHVRVYKNNSTESWTQVGQDIDGEAKWDMSGFSVALSADGNIVAIGAIKNDNGTVTNSGQVRVYEKNSTEYWTQVGQDINGETGSDKFGSSVALSADGNILAIGARWGDSNGTDSGHVRVYERSPRSRSESYWLQKGQFDGEEAKDKFGISIALSADGSTLAIGGSKNDNGNDTNSGHVRVYKKDSKHDWKQVGQEIHGEAARDNFGASVALSNDGNILAIGAFKNDNENGQMSGHVRVFQISDDLSNDKIKSTYPSSNPSSFPSIAPTPYLENTFSIRMGKNISASFGALDDDSNISVSFHYNKNDLIHPVATIWTADNCNNRKNTSEVPNDDIIPRLEASFGDPISTLPVNLYVNTANITNSAYWNYDTPANTSATIQFCLRADLEFDIGGENKSLSFYETIVSVQLDMTLDVGDQVVSLEYKEPSEEATDVAMSFDLQSWICYEDAYIWKQFENPRKYTQNSKINVCIFPSFTDKDAILVDGIKELTLAQDEYMYAIINDGFQVVSDVLTQVEAVTGPDSMQGMKITTYLISEFFQDIEPNDITASGAARIAFKSSSSRRLNERERMSNKHTEEEEAEAMFSFTLDLDAADAEGKVNTNAMKVSPLNPFFKMGIISLVSIGVVVGAVVFMSKKKQFKAEMEVIH